MKTKRQKRIFITALLFCMVVMYGFMPPVFRAGAVNSIADASDLITDSDPGQTATHTFTFTSTTTIPADGYIDLAFDSNFSGLATTSVTCAYGAAGITEQLFEDSDTVRCLFTGQQTGTSTQVVVTDVVNPGSENEYAIWIRTYDDSDTLLDRVRVWVAIFEDVLMTATVNSTLDFHIYGTSTAGIVGGIPCSNESTPTEVPFGDLIVGATSTVCQTLTVETNADDGYTVTVFQDHEMLSDSGSNINSFKDAADDSGTTVPEAWVAPTNQLDQYHTYGHMGLHTDDSDLEAFSTGYEDFDTAGATLFAGLNSSDPMPIMHHDGPTDGSTPNVGSTNVIYQAEIGSLQEAGDYESTLTYICTPTF